jgi:hypothetical protein
MEPRHVAGEPRKPSGISRTFPADLAEGQPAADRMGENLDEVLFFTFDPGTKCITSRG